MIARSAERTPQLPSALMRWDLATEAITVKIRWLGLILGYIYVFFESNTVSPTPLTAILTLGLAYTLVDTWYSWHGRVVLGRYPLIVSGMEALFIGFLCYFDGGLDSPFRYYYLLSLICCAIRHKQDITYVSCGLHCLSCGTLHSALPDDGNLFPLFMLIVLLVWITWAASAMSRTLKQLGEQLIELNQDLNENKELLESRIQERTRELQETQAQLMHQDKMAGFGLLAAGIAHEVGNPLTSISSLIQMLEKRHSDVYTSEKLGLVGGQVGRIQGIVRELMNFSRPASQERTRYHVHDIVDEALNIAKYYKGGKSRILQADVPKNLPILYGVKDQIVQVLFNLVLNAIDATPKGGRIEVKAAPHEEGVEIVVSDNGSGIDENQQHRLFQPYFTTKKTGTGLGLFVIQKIVLEHGGKVTFESAVGKGTTFRIVLPFASPVIPTREKPPEAVVPKAVHEEIIKE